MLTARSHAAADIHVVMRFEVSYSAGAIRRRGRISGRTLPIEKLLR
jgi:hypothetical protein